MPDRYNLARLARKSFNCQSGAPDAVPAAAA
jgi:hypothetical protein